MSQKLTINDACRFLSENDDFIIFTHKKPDGDTLGSACALCSALRRIGKRAFLCNNNGITEKFSPYTAPYIIPDGTDFSTFTTVSVDVASVNMLPEGFPTAVELAIDHHPSNSLFADKTLLDGGMAACGEIILRVIIELTGKIEKNEADLLYIAISTDTGCFQYGNTDADAFSDAAVLAAAGADILGLNTLFFRTFSKSRLLLEGYIYSTLRSYRDNKINIAVVTREMIDRAGATDNDMDDVASLAGRVMGNVVSVTIKENDRGFSKVSMRSNGTVNVSDVCARFGGGGHAMAAGCEVSLCPEEAADAILNVLGEYSI